MTVNLMISSFRSFSILACVLVGATLAAPLAHAQIYKWVDDDGRVHFGDKPVDSREASNAKEVTVKQSYVPTNVPASDTAAAAVSSNQAEAEMRQAEAATQRSLNERRAREARKQEQEKADLQEAQARIYETCVAYLKEIDALTEVRLVNDRPTFYYLTHEDGTDYTSAEQDAHVENLRAKTRELGCKDIRATAAN